ncbi:MAG: hypothetical protein M3Y87_12055 [Myxococcota bacterium]|nr:hypothetical protein [Myxococcota bacterium]
MALGVLALSGCFDSHGMQPDPGAGADGGMCLELPATVSSIRCDAAPGAESSVTISTSPSRCCSTGTATPMLRRSGDAFDVELTWNACDCCEGCRCVGPVEEVRVSLGVLEPGVYTVRSHGSSCTLAITTPPMCRSVSADETRVPRVLFDDQPLAATLIERDEVSCSCTPAARLQRSPELALGMELCECCDECDCIDGGYEASVVSDVLPVGTHTLSLPRGPHTVQVTTRDRCRALAPTGLRIVAPGPLVRAGPAIHWAVISGTERLCCMPPAPAVDEGIGPAGERALSLRTCVESDCECIGAEVPFEAWHPLIDLAPGTHVVRAGAFEEAITVTP